MKNLKIFLERIKGDHRIGPAHISLYVALLDLCPRARPREYFPIRRREVMAKSKILGKTLYYKCLGELADFGYIEYRPEYHPGRRSGVKIFVESVQQ